MDRDMKSSFSEKSLFWSDLRKLCKRNNAKAQLREMVKAEETEG